MAICWERAVPLAFFFCCFYFSAVLIVGVPFPFGVYGRMWNSIVSVPDRCLFIYFTARQDHFSHSEPSQSSRGAKAEDLRGKPHDHRQDAFSLEIRVDKEPRRYSGDKPSISNSALLGIRRRQPPLQ